MEHSTGTFALIAGGIGLLALLRRLSRPVEAASLESPKLATIPVAPGAPELEDVPRLRVRKHYYRSFDSNSGPPDPETFYDELLVEIEDTETGESWTQSCFVGTPSGISRAMQQEGWDYMLGTDLLIVRRFDGDLILGALLEHIEERYEIAPELPRDPHLG